MVPIGVVGFVFIAGALVSLLASGLLVARLERVADTLGFSEAILGLVVALAADAPEISSAITALIRRQHSVGVGVVLGSNVFNLAALLGLGAVVASQIRLHRRVIIFAGAVAMWIATISVGVVVGILNVEIALFLAFMVLIPYVLLSAASGRQPGSFPLPKRCSEWLHAAVMEEELELMDAFHTKRGDAGDVVVASAALVVVIGASVAMELSATSLGNRYSVSNIVVGGIVLAGVTSVPNAVAAVYLASRGRGSAVLSEALNSNMLNVVVGLLIPAAFLGVGHRIGSSVLAAGCQRVRRHGTC